MISVMMMISNPASFNAGFDTFATVAFNLAVIGIAVLGRDVSYIPVIIIVALAIFGLVIFAREIVRAESIITPDRVDTPPIDEELDAPKDNLINAPRDRFSYRTLWFDESHRRGYNVVKKSAYLAEVEVQSAAHSSKYAPSEHAVNHVLGIDRKAFANAYRKADVSSRQYNNQALNASNAAGPSPNLTFNEFDGMLSTKMPKKAKEISKMETKDEMKSVSSENYAYKLSMRSSLRPTMNPPTEEKPDDVDPQSHIDKDPVIGHPSERVSPRNLGHLRMPSAKSTISKVSSIPKEKFERMERMSTKSTQKGNAVDAMVNQLSGAFRPPDTSEVYSESTRYSDKDMRMPVMEGQPSMLLEPMVEQMRQMSAESMDSEHPHSIAQWLADSDDEDDDGDDPDHQAATLESQMQALKLIPAGVDANARMWNEQAYSASIEERYPARSKRSGEDMSLKSSIQNTTLARSLNAPVGDIFQDALDFDDEAPIPHLLEEPTRSSPLPAPVPQKSLRNRQENAVQADIYIPASSKSSTLSYVSDMRNQGNSPKQAVISTKGSVDRSAKGLQKPINMPVKSHLAAERDHFMASMKSLKDIGAGSGGQPNDSMGMNVPIRSGRSVREHAESSGLGVGLRSGSGLGAMRSATQKQSSPSRSYELEVDRQPASLNTYQRRAPIQALGQGHESFVDMYSPEKYARTYDDSMAVPRRYDDDDDYDDYDEDDQGYFPEPILEPIAGVGGLAQVQGLLPSPNVGLRQIQQMSQRSPTGTGPVSQTENRYQPGQPNRSQKGQYHGSTRY
jgi:hypothetical protein